MTLPDPKNWTLHEINTMTMRDLARMIADERIKNGVVEIPQRPYSAIEMDWLLQCIFVMDTAHRLSKFTPTALMYTPSPVHGKTKPGRPVDRLRQMIGLLVSAGWIQRDAWEIFILPELVRSGVIALVDGQPDPYPTDEQQEIFRKFWERETKRQKKAGFI